MGSTNILSYLITATLLLGCSQPKFISSAYKKEVQESILEIPKEEYSFDEKTNIFYRLTNDEQHFFIDLKIADESIQKKILLYGLSTELKVDEGKFGFKYPLPANRNILKNKGERRKGGSNKNKRIQAPDFNDLRNSIISQARSIEKISFATDGDPLVCEVDRGGLNGEMSITEFGELCYRLTVPLSEIGVTTQNGEVFINTSLESGYLNPENIQAGMRQRGMGKSMQGMSGMSSRGGGGRGQSRMGGSTKMQEFSGLTTPFKLKLGLIKLSPKNEN